MHIYELGYHSYEESQYTQLYHEKKFNQNEFEKIICQAAANILKGYKIRKGERISFQDINFSVAEELIKNFGFKKVNFAATFNVFGWANILDEKDWEHDRDEQLNLLTKSLRKPRQN